MRRWSGPLSLPPEPYVFAQWKECRAGIDYHVEVKPYFYSVSYTLLRETMWVRYTEHTVEVFHRDYRVAAHPRIPPDGRKHSTLPEHMPSSHRRYADWTLERIKRQAGEIGPNASALVEIIRVKGSRSAHRDTSRTERPKYIS